MTDQHQPPAPLDDDFAPAPSIADTIRMARQAAEQGNIYPDVNPNTALATAAASLEVAVVPGTDGAISSNASSQQQQQQQRPQPVWVPVRPARSHPAALASLSTAFFAERAADADHSATAGLVAFGFVVVWGACCALYVWSTLLFANHQSDPCDRPLPVWCLVTGVAGLTSLTLALIKVALLFERPRRVVGRRCGPALHLGIERAHSVLSAFGVAWLVVGSVWTYGLGDPDTFGGTSACADAVFLFCWYVITATWGFVAFCCLFGSIFWCCASFFQWQF